MPSVAAGLSPGGTSFCNLDFAILLSKSVPQRLKPSDRILRFGTAEAVPFVKRSDVKPYVLLLCEAIRLSHFQRLDSSVLVIVFFLILVLVVFVLIVFVVFV